jgi:hypothetical protein
MHFVLRRNLDRGQVLEYEVRMQNLILSFGLLALVACGGSSNAPANDPSSTGAAPASTASTTTTTTETSTTATGGDAKPGDAKPADGKCGTTTTTSASDMDMCKAECEKLDDKAPAGSRCLPPRTSCKMNCDQKFKK